MQATTARGTDAERTEEAAPVADENVVVDAGARLVLEDKVVGLEVLCEVVELVLLPVGRVARELVIVTTESDADAIVDVSVGGRDGTDAVPELGTTLGKDSVTPPSLHKKSSENHWNSMVNKRGAYVGAGAVSDVSPCGSAMAVAATARRVKN